MGIARRRRHWMPWDRRGRCAGPSTGFVTWTSRVSWIVFHTAPWLLKKLWLLVDHSDSQAFVPALSHKHRFQLAALYTLQHRLTRNTQFRCGYDHGHILGWRLLHDARPQFLSDADLPWRAWRNLLAGNEAIGQPAMNAARVHAENLRGLANRHQLSIGRRRRRLETWDAAIPS